MESNNGNSTKKFEEALHLLNEAARDKKDEIQNLLGDKYSDISQLLKQASTKSRRELRKVQRSAEEWMEEGGESLKETVTQLDDSVRENPWPYLGGVAVGAILLGFILGSSSRNK